MVPLLPIAPARVSTVPGSTTTLADVAISCSVALPSRCTSPLPELASVPPTMRVAARFTRPPAAATVPPALATVPCSSSVPAVASASPALTVAVAPESTVNCPRLAFSTPCAWFTTASVPLPSRPCPEIVLSALVSTAPTAPVTVCRVDELE